jgi:hypothetical protein
MRYCIVVMQMFFSCCFFEVLDASNVNLNWWDQDSERWETAICVSGGGNCVKFQGSTFRLFGTYVKKGTRLTVHVNNHGTRNLLMHVRSGEPPTSKLNDYKVNRRDPGFTQWTCKGVYIYWIVQADISELTSMVS